jgi:predicted Zn finger-like uncharacterized protein
MIIACPACATRYDIPDAAIGPQGRKLKCAACGHGWHADPASALPPEASPEPAAPPPAPVSPPPAPPLPVAPEVPPPFDPPPQATEEAMLDEAPSPFDYQPPLEPRRAGIGWLGWIAAIVVLLALAAYAVFAFDVGGLRTRLSVASAGTASPLVVRFTSTPFRRSMESGNELLQVQGQVVNPAATSQRVPDIRAELRDAQGRTVYNWTIGAPVARLAPGAKADFDAAEVDVPAAARTIHLRAGPTPRV